MPNQLTISSINVVVSKGEETTTAKDLPVRPSELEALEVSEDFLLANGFDGKLQQTLLVPQQQVVAIALGLGEQPITTANARATAATLWHSAKHLDSLTSSLPLSISEDLGNETALQATVEGLLLASYRFDELKGTPEPAPNLQRIDLLVPDGVDSETALRKAEAVASAIALSRDLVNRPGGALSAIQIADEAMLVAEKTGLEIEIWDKQRLAEEDCGGILGVNAGSLEEPRLVRLTWRPQKESRGTIHFVGKGITFDTGGLNLKTFEGMKEMKIDMGGAAAVIGAMAAVAAYAPDLTVIGTCCCTDNQPSPTATKPGDVLKIRNGKTVEVLNTDAEGRLVLADGLSIAAEEEPDLIVDLATLTGACMVALGQRYGGLMGNNETAIAKVQTAAAQANELLWHLPLPKEYRKQLDSEIADLQNIGSGRFGGTLVAGLFLQEFVGETPWVHLDIAGPVTTDENDGEFSKGATGFGVRTLIEIVNNW